MDRRWHDDDINRMTPDEIRAYCQAAPEYVRELDDFGYTPLIAACERGNAGAVRVLLEAGADPDFIASDGVSPLKAAIPQRDQPFNRELFDLLLAAGAKPNLGLVPVLHLAVGQGDQELVQYLVEGGADTNLDDVDGAPPLFWAGAYGGPPDIPMMRLLIEHGADVTRRDGIQRSLEQRIGRRAMAEVMRR
jgi:ankyrin repeat protein